ncbi:TfoX/Sxy family protein [Zavarzinella formosa]|uniref:TfoX/Sxy family protein n=1 Tax=Zavarzinella formosa TaxID=360055 RepID=UPI00030FE6FC|nr:TfoX/Sxy family protein [Zavarzinella formosa]
MPFDATLAARVRENLGRSRNIVEKKMFGGIAFLLNGNLLVGVRRNALLVRVGPEAYEEALLESFAGEFGVADKPKRGWVLVEPEGVEHDEQLNEWIQKAWRFVDTLSAK